MNDLLQTTFDYDALDADTRDFVQQKTLAIQARLKRTAEDIIMIGKDLQAVQQRLKEKNQAGEKQGNGQFLYWIGSEFDMSQATAYRFMSVAERFGEKLITVISFSPRVLYELAAPSTPDEVIQMVEIGQIEPNLEEIRKAKEALKRVEQLEQQIHQQAQLAQHQLFQERQTRLEAQAQLEQYNQQIARLQEQITTITKPEETIREIEVIPLDVTKELLELHEKVAFLTRHRDKLAEEAKELGKIAEVATTKRNEQEQDIRIRQRWRVTCTDLKQAVLKALSHWPLAADTEVFEAYDWDCLVETRNTINHFLEVCNTLHGNNGGMIIDAVEA